MADAPSRSDRPPQDAARHARAKQVFLDALARPAAGREAWLAQACGGDAGLADEVRSLLAHHTAATLRAPGPPTAAAAPPPHAPAAAPTVPLGLRKRVVDRDGPARRRRLALVLALGGLLLMAGALLVRRATERELRGLVERQLLALLGTQEVGLRTWLEGELHLVREFAASRRVRELAAGLAAAAHGSDPQAALSSGEALRASAELAAVLEPQARRGEDHGRRGFALVDPAGRVLASSLPVSDPEVRVEGTLLNEAGRREVELAAQGGPRVRLPYRRGTFHDAVAERADEVLLAVLAPVAGEDGGPLAVLAFVQHAEDVFGALLAEGRSGASGDTFAFDAEGRLLSASRHAGAPVGDGTHPALAGMARAAVASPGPLVDVEGHPGVHGGEVVGAWRWLPEHDCGLATELSVDEAFAALEPVRRSANRLLGAAVAGLVLAAAAGAQVARLRREVRRERLLGQYELQEVIGQGGAGQVWRARHALLQRPTAVKLLRPELLSPAALELLEREVRITARLTHPNTIEVYDCGVAEDGRFFYAMELLDGLSLQHLVARHGRQPVARAVHILRQMCASLAEAHAAGLVHRDVKPGNAMLCRLGGELDVVKVLDFGLVKDTAAPAAEGAPTLALSGTPLYMSPERLQPGVPADPRCDVWALGATAFKLLAGRDLWSGSVADVLVQVMTQRAPRVAAHAQVPPGLDALLAECLDPDPARRPADARALLARVEALPVPPWTQADARAWWAAHAGA